ncbi:MAG: PIG-L family deacetylase, partial [Candidatus Corynebacterium faecigallinarum]
MNDLQDVRILAVHAHPDDESLWTGLSLAQWARRGAEVTVVTCTLGEEGEVIGEKYAGLVADDHDILGGYRIAELQRALGELGVGRPRFLGGPGRWRDSGVGGAAAAGHPASV